MKRSNNLSHALKVTVTLGLVAGSTWVMAAQWTLLGTKNSEMENLGSYASQAECAKALAAALKVQSQRDFMCVDNAKTPVAPKK